MAGYYFGCPHCGAKLEARDASRAGRAVNCPQCQQALTIPPPPPMGVAISGPAGPSDVSSQVNVSTDKGFKRGMIPAKAYPDSDSPPSNPESAGRLPTESLDNAEPFVLNASDDVEGYSLTIPESVPETAEPSVPRKKKKRDRTQPEPEPEVEPTPPWEDPKYQLLALVLVAGLVAVIWNWFTSGSDDKKQEEVFAPPPAVVEPTKEGMLPGATEVPAPVNDAPTDRLPGADVPAGMNTLPPATQPGPSDHLPGAEAPATNPPPTTPSPAPESSALPGAEAARPGAMSKNTSTPIAPPAVLASQVPPFGSPDGAVLNRPEEVGPRIVRDGVLATQVTGLPDGIEVKGLMAWGAMNSGGTYPHPLTLNIALIEQRGEELVTVGHPRAVRTETVPPLGRPLFHCDKSSGRSISIGQELRAPAGIYPYHPKWGRRIEVNFDHPLAPIEKFSADVEFDVEQAEQVELISIPGLTQNTLPEINHPLLQKLQFRWGAWKGNDLYFSYIRSDNLLITDMKFANPDGRPFGMFVGEHRSGFLRKKPDETITEGTMVEFTIATQLSRNTVRAKFTDLPVGPSPIVTPAEQHNHRWTTAQLTGAPEGLDFAAKVVRYTHGSQPLSLHTALSGSALPRLFLLRDVKLNMQSSGRSLAITPNDQADWLAPHVIHTDEGDWGEPERIVQLATFTPDASAAGPLIDPFEGTFTVDTVEAIETVTIPDVFTLHGKFLEHPDLKAAGYSIEVQVRDASVGFRLRSGEMSLIGKAELLSAGGLVIEERSPAHRVAVQGDQAPDNFFLNVPEVEYSFLPADELKTEGASVRLHLLKNRQSHQVKFKFPPVQMPPPVMPAQGQPPFEFGGNALPQ